MLFSAMSRRRVSCPLTTQQLWDAVKIIRYKRQVANLDRITKYMTRYHGVSEDEVARQLNYCVRDGLLKLIKKMGKKGAQLGVEQEGYKLPEEKIEKDSHDWYCFECHSGGDVICCTSCHRVYHLSCISKDDLPEDDVKNKFVCNVCKRILSKYLTPVIKKSQLNRLLKYTAAKLKDRLPISLTDRQVPSNTSYISERFALQAQVKKPSIDVPTNFKWILNDKDDWRVDNLIYKDVNLPIMESKAECGKYEHLEEFRADLQTIVHNVVIYHGVNSNMADIARLMLRDCSTDLSEIMECWLCYKHSNDKSLKNWFCKPCKPPHELVYAKSKGCPYWPAKVLKKTEDSYEVRYFGNNHEKAIVEKSHIRPISVNIHTLQVKSNSGWNKACEELKRYQKQLEKNLSSDSSSSSDIDSEDGNNSSIADNEEDRLQENISPSTETNEQNKQPLTLNVKEEKLENGFDKVSMPRKRGRPRKIELPTRRSSSKSDEDDSVADSERKIDFDDVSGREDSEQNTSMPNEDSNNSVIDVAEVKRENGKVKRNRGPSEHNSMNKKVKNSLSSGCSSEDIKQNGNLNHLPTNTTEEYNITSTSLTKSNEEEIVSSSSSQNPSKRSVKTQTKSLDKPSKEWILKMEQQFEEEKNMIIEKLTKEHEHEVAVLRAAHTAILSETKRKQWCVNCEQEAIYHCCWNTSYCSLDCQLTHWAADHKRHCRRKR